MANKPLEYKGHPLQRAGNIVYYGSMSDKYVIMLQIMDTKKVKDLDVATKVSVQLQLTDPSVKSRDRIVKKAKRTASGRQWMLQVSGSTGLWLQNNHKNLKADGFHRLLFVIILPKIDIEFEEILYYNIHC